MRFPITPVEKVGSVFVKRDDLFTFGKVNGAKVRPIVAIAKRTGAAGLLTSGSRQGTTGVVAAAVCAELGLKFEFHSPAGAETGEHRFIKKCGGSLVLHRLGYLSVVRARAHAAIRPDWVEIPYGVECPEMVQTMAEQMENLPFSKIKRIVIAVGGGMALAGILAGLKKHGQSKLKVLGVQIGSLETAKRLDRFAPWGWSTMNVELVRSELSYSTTAPDCNYGGIKLDPIYEAKVLPFLKSGDLFWNTALRPTV